MALFLVEALSQGLLYAILAIAVLMTYKILDFSDLSVEGTVPLGGVICAMVIVSTKNPFLGLFLALIAGFIAGLVTGLLHVKCGISALLSGIMVMTGLYSVNVMIAPSSNIPVYNYKTIFSSEWLLSSITDRSLSYLLGSIYNVVVLLLIVVIVKLAIDWLLNTKFGFLIRITGDNPQLVSSLGEDVGKIKIISVAISNAIAAFFGGVCIQLLGYYDLTMGTGIIATGLAAVILGTTIFKRANKIKMTTMVMVGAVLYRLAIAIAYRLDAPPSFEKIIIVLIFLITITLNNGTIKNLIKKFQRKEKKHDQVKSYSKNI